MLYVFYVETGTMLTFEMNLAVDTVDVLMSAIAKCCAIPKDEQVLLVSGGTELNPKLKVCEYGSGTDTCPIFLFTKYANESDIPPHASIGNVSDVSMEEQVKECLDLPVTYRTVSARAELAQQFADLATNELRICERLVHDQRLQQQGWATAIANFQDISNNFRKGAHSMSHMLQQYFDSRQYYIEILENSHGVIDLLSTIPLLPSLLLKNYPEAEKDYPKQTLLDCICEPQPKSCIDNFISKCLQTIDNLDEKVWCQTEEDLKNVLDTLEDTKVTEVKGLEERLYSLDKLMCEAKKCERDQVEQAQNLLNHHVRINNLKDNSVLPDLCMTHQHQIQLMLKNHQNLRDIRERCTRAKIELCNNLHARLKRVKKVENQIFETTNRILLFRDYLTKLGNGVKTIQEVRSAPTSYLKAVVEVCRRRNFSNNFLKWSFDLSVQSHELYKNEVTLRKEFNSEFSNSFIEPLFPGMEDFPPPFATECPEPFDLHLPKIVPEDVDRLKQCLPGLLSMLEVPRTVQMPQVCVTSDSAFSSEVPSSRAGMPFVSSSLCPHALKSEVQECACVSDHDCLLNDLSFTSSPFEDALMSTVPDDAPSKGKSQLKKKHDDIERDCKRLHLADCVLDKEIFSPIEEEQRNDSDAEEFEQVDEVPKSDNFENPCPMTVVSEVCDIKKNSDLNKIVATENVISGSVSLPRAASSCRMTSPLEEGLRSPDSMLTSQDFQPTDYFIDDSMPSSYTESNGTSALIRGNQMVKSHHVIVAELQNQIEEKNFALASAQGNLKMNRTNILKLRRTITALQKYIQDIQDGLKRELVVLKECVLNEKSIALGQISDIMEEVKTVVSGMQSRIYSEQETAINDAVKREREMMESILQKYQYQLEIEGQKLSDCHTEIDVYQEQIRQHQIVLDDLKQESDNKLQDFKKDLCDEKDQLINGMILEHELELENLRDILKKTVQEKEGDALLLRKALSDKEAQLHLLLIEKESLQTEQMENINKEKEQWTNLTELKLKEEQDVAIEHALDKQNEEHNEELERMKMEYESHLLEMQKQMKHNLDEEYTEKILKLKSEIVKEYEQTLAEQKALYKREMDEIFHSNQILIARYKREMESMGAQFKRTFSASFMEKSSGSSLEDFMDVVPQQMSDSLQKMSVSDPSKDVMESLQEDSLETERKKHQNEIVKLKASLQKEYEEQLEKFKMHHRAKKQVTFNEAINRATRDKDILIGELRQRISVLETEQNPMNYILDQVMQVIQDVKMEVSSNFSCDESLIKNKTCMMEKLCEAEQKIEEMKVEIMSSFLCDFGHHQGPSNIKEKNICELKMMLQKKEEELEKMRTKVMKLSMYESARSSLSSDKVSVMSCSIGEIVILYYDEKHENYMVLQFAAGPHFLHCDSFNILNIKIPPVDPKKHWTLAQVTGKEYCQAKKINNRYKVPYGSRFYRIKVQPWDREAAFLRHSQRRHSQMLFSTSSETSEAGPSEVSSGIQMSASAI